jgi:diadenosine tetraphosphate (Ap4A) HIT family hydrolase
LPLRVERRVGLVPLVVVIVQRKGTVVDDCLFCQLIEKNDLWGLISENDRAVASAEGYFREGHCMVITKRHITSISEMTKDEWSDVTALIATVSKTLEAKYECEKTYLLSIGDQVSHLHFHLIPKHKDLCSMGEYCFHALFKAEGERSPSEMEQKLLADEIRERM